jgi:hypothetical protein
MRTKLKQIIAPVKNERGNFLVLTLVFVLLGILIVTPLVTFMGTGLSTGRIFEQKTNRLYAADAGIQGGNWLIKYNHLESVIQGYTPYNFTGTWSYDVPEEVNGVTASVTIQNVWMPKDLEPPGEENAERLISGTGGELPKIIVTSSVSETFIDHDNPGVIEIKIQYYPEASDDLKITSLESGCQAGLPIVKIWKAISTITP